MARKRKEVLGLKFNDWTVTNVEIEQKDHHRRVECTCVCGNISKVRVDNLLNGISSNCGCKRTEDLVGNRYEKLVVLESLGTKKGKQILVCKCDCGKTTITTYDNAKRGITKSCGCITSYINNQIENWLLENNYNFKREYRIPDCKNKRPLPFDFAVFLPKLKLIEFQGSQHYKIVKGWGGQSRFQNNQITDKIKFEYCKNNEIELLCIPYWETKTMFKQIEKFLT
jgi:hypothetical protein